VKSLREKAPCYLAKSLIKKCHSALKNFLDGSGEVYQFPGRLLVANMMVWSDDEKKNDQTCLLGKSVNK
jgi:hypothetical protein